MPLQKISKIYLTQPVRVISPIILIAVLSMSPCYGDEVIFKEQKGVQTGIVLEEDEHSVTIRFPRESVESIIRSQEGDYSNMNIKTKNPETASPMESQFKEKIERLQERIEGLEKTLQEIKKVNHSLPLSSPSKGIVANGQLLHGEMGRVEGVILWKGKPLANRSVMIVLEKNTGFSWAFIKKMFPGELIGQTIALTTQTDSGGKYVFEKVPPGQYRLYWVPDAKTGWVHRMRERPDFEVIAGERTAVNIPDVSKK